MSSEYRARREIVRYGRRLRRDGFIAAADGNLTIRLSSDRLLITPSGRPKGGLVMSDLVVVDLEGRVYGPGSPSSEIGLHLEAFRARPDVQAAVHAHPPWTIAASIQPDV